jgi:hypothetical protein
MRWWAICLVSAGVLGHSPAVAQVGDLARRLEIDVRAAYVVLGGERATGGLMPLAAARHTWLLSDVGDVAVGAEFGAFGFGSETRWIGILGGPTVSGSARPWSGPVAVSLAFAASVGRIPVCNDWGLCLRYVGLFPSANLSVAYYTNRVLAIGASCSVRYVDTLAWTGASWEPSVIGRFWW